MVKKTLIKLSRFLAQQVYRGPVGIWVRGESGVQLSFGFEPGIWQGLMRLIGGDLSRFFSDLARGQTRQIRATTSYAASLLLSVPPFPAMDRGGPSTMFDVPGDLLIDFHPTSGALSGTTFQSEPKIGYLTHTAPSMTALRGIYDKVGRLPVRDLQYRTDIVSNQTIGRVRDLLRRVSVEGAASPPVEPLTSSLVVTEATIGGTK